MKVRRTILILCLLFCVAAVCFIFWNSFQDLETSREFSSRIAEILRPFLDSEHADKYFHKHIRKLAHFVEFCIFGGTLGMIICLIRAFCGRYHFALGLFILLSIAVLDEHIQSFTGRASSVTDILIDFCGGFTGLIFVLFPVLFVQFLYRRTGKKRNRTRRE